MDAKQQKHNLKSPSSSENKKTEPLKQYSQRHRLQKTPRKARLRNRRNPSKPKNVAFATLSTLCRKGTFETVKREVKKPQEGDNKRGANLAWMICMPWMDKGMHGLATAAVLSRIRLWSFFPYSSPSGKAEGSADFLACAINPSGKAQAFRGSLLKCVGRLSQYWWVSKWGDEKENPAVSFFFPTQNTNSLLDFEGLP